VRKLAGPEDLALLSDGLSSCGVALVIELPLRNSKLDGIVLWREGKPIIGLTTRYDRMDSFVFTLLHEIAHLTLGHITADGLHIDEDLDPGSDLDIEREANDQASAWIIPTMPVLDVDELTALRLMATSRELGVHPSFLIGRLQRDRLLPWSRFRTVIPKVRPYVAFG
jgi:HTH-type transcriptional regulator/antitoxin HigA